jgi:hypothetical protein
MKKLKRTLFIVAFIGCVQSVWAVAAWQPGVIVLAEDRFDPAIQRLIAEFSLRSLPLQRGQFYYLYPVGVDPHIEEMQIRYLEVLLDKRDADGSAQDPADEPDSR